MNDNKTELLALSNRFYKPHDKHMKVIAFTGTDEEIEACLYEADQLVSGGYKLKPLMEWIKIKCPKCGKESNYKRTKSGKAPCSATRCTWLIDVGKMTAEEKEAYSA